MKKVALAFAAGVVAGLVLHSQLVGPSEMELQQALAALSMARDSLMTATTSEVRVDTVTIVRTVNTVDTIIEVRRATSDTVLLTTVRIDSVFIVDTIGVHWLWSDSTAAYKIEGTSHANVRIPSLSYTDYSLDVFENKIRARSFRIAVGGGVFGGVPFSAINVRIRSRLWLGGQVGAVSDDNKISSRYGVSAMWGLF